MYAVIGEVRGIAAGFQVPRPSDQVPAGRGKAVTPAAGSIAFDERGEAPFKVYEDPK